MSPRSSWLGPRGGAANYVGSEPSFGLQVAPWGCQILAARVQSALWGGSHVQWA